MGSRCEGFAFGHFQSGMVAGGNGRRLFEGRERQCGEPRVRVSFHGTEG